MRRSAVEVAIRVRPMRPELNETKSAWDVQQARITERRSPENSFTFDRIYDTDSTTLLMYEQSVRDTIVKSVVQGYNGTVFAYGQTGSGKSYTMLGYAKETGVVTLAVNDLFKSLEAERGKKGVSINIFVAMLEIYNEQLRDLLVAPGTASLPLSIRENEHGVYVHNAIRRSVTSAQQCLHAIHSEAEERRTSAATAMNEHSSRSHCLIRILVEKKVILDAAEVSDNDDDGEEDPSGSSRLEKKVVSTMNLVDLAGSERVSKTGATGMRMVEGGHINKSLTTLTTVINRLTDKATTSKSYIPYRDSKLTHLLKTALGGNSFTTVFCCLTPAEQHSDESRSTLQFASRAKTIKNQVVMNEVADNKTRLREMEIQIKQLKRMLVASDIYLWSKELRIRNLKEQGGPQQTDNVQVEQMESLIQHLTVQNGELQEQLNNAVAFAAPGGVGVGGAAAHVDPMMGFADDDEKRELRGLCEELQSRVTELEVDKSAMAANVKDLEEIADELGRESDEKDVVISGQKQGLAQQQAKLHAYEQEIATLHTQMGHLQEQRRFEEQAMMQRARGDELMENLTKLHVERAALQLEHTTLMDMYSRTEIEKAAEIARLEERLAESQAEVETQRTTAMQHQSFLWRLISVASFVTHGKAGEVTGIIREHQVESAIKQLTSFVQSRAGRPPNVNPSSRSATDVLPGEGGDGGTSAGAAGSNGAQMFPHSVRGQSQTTDAVAGDAVLVKRIEHLEQQLLVKDAQRDIIIDAKLKRIQDLVLRLHTTNLKLKDELHVACGENARLQDFIKADGKLSKLLRKEGIAPLSEGEMMSRALYAPVPMPPYGHN